MRPSEIVAAPRTASTGEAKGVYWILTTLCTHLLGGGARGGACIRALCKGISTQSSSFEQDGNA